MKKTVTLPDGTMEVLEGTPEEIAAHEKLIRENGKQQPKSKKPDVLKGQEVEEDFAKKLQDIFDKLPKVPSYPQYPVQPWWPSERPIWIASCSQCSSYPCICQHYEMYPKIICRTETVTSNGTALTCSAPQRPDRYESFFGS